MPADKAGAGNASQAERELLHLIKLELSHDQSGRDEPARAGGKSDEAKSPPA
jgi:hypothetical protein